MFENRPQVHEKVQVFMDLSKGKTMELFTFEPSAFEPPSGIITREAGQRKTTLLSKTLLLLRENKILYSGILAPGTIKENTRDGFFLKGLRTGEGVELCNKENPAWIQQDLFHFSPEG